MPRHKKAKLPDAKLEDEKSYLVQLGTAGRLVIPQAVRDELDLDEGVQLRVRARHGRIIISTAAGDLEFAKEQFAKTIDEDV